MKRKKKMNPETKAVFVFMGIAPGSLAENLLTIFGLRKTIFHLEQANVSNGTDT